MKFACCKSSTEGATGTIQCRICKDIYHNACIFLTDKKERIIKKTSDQKRNGLARNV